MKKLFIFLFVGIFIFSGAAVMAQDLGGGGLSNVAIKAGVNTTPLETKIGGIIATILGMLGTVFLVLTIYAGVLWMTASGDEGKIEKAKEIITAAVIGLAIVLSAYTITYFVGSKLGAGAGGSGEGCCTIAASNGEAEVFDSPQSACKSEDPEITASWSATPCK